MFDNESMLNVLTPVIIIMLTALNWGNVFLSLPRHQIMAGMNGEQITRVVFGFEYTFE